MSKPLQRLLFASCHGYLDPSSGAALATRDLLELLTTRGVDCRVLSTGVLDYDQETALESVMEPMGLPTDRAHATLRRGIRVDVFDLVVEGVRATLLPTASSLATRSPDRAESLAFLDLAEQAMDRFRPQILLTYGGHPASLELMRRARARGIAVVFHLHNFAYPDRGAFAHASAVLVPSEYARRHYGRSIGLETTAIPYPLRPARAIAAESEPRYVTFVNPQVTKGAAVFARIAVELHAKRPEIPLLVVEGRSKADGLAGVGLDLSGLTNLHRMANTPDPRDFYRVSRIVLVPSVWRETFGRVAAEALANGLPVLASDRGALPETLGEAGFLFALPDSCTPAGGSVPTPREIAPWIATIERLWDDPVWEAEHRSRALETARRWDDSLLAERYEEFFGRLIGSAAIPSH
jgi:glycosyltransferase involved in cell wall biosynthesis